MFIYMKDENMKTMYENTKIKYELHHGQINIYDLCSNIIQRTSKYIVMAEYAPY